MYTKNIDPSSSPKKKKRERQKKSTSKKNRWERVRKRQKKCEKIRVATLYFMNIKRGIIMT
jgi:hypothetical protein